MRRVILELLLILAAFGAGAALAAHGLTGLGTPPTAATQPSAPLSEADITLITRWLGAIPASVTLCGAGATMPAAASATTAVCQEATAELVPPPPQVASRPEVAVVYADLRTLTSDGAAGHGAALRADSAGLAGPLTELEQEVGYSPTTTGAS